MSGVGKALVVIGGTVVTAGLVWWWLKEHPIVPPKPKCEDYKTESECAAAGCYWYNNKCHSTPEAPPETHYDCIKDPMTGLIMCSLVEGAGDNICDPFAPPDYCWDKVPCSLDKNCGVGAKCWEGTCYWTANELLDWEGTHVYQIRFDFEKRVVGNKLMGDIGFKLDAWNVDCTPHVKIYLIRDNKRVRCIYDHMHEGLPWTWGDPAYRTDPFSVFIAAEAVDGIEFWCKCTRGFPWDSFSPVLIKVHAQYLYL